MYNEECQCFFSVSMLKTSCRA